MASSCEKIGELLCNRMKDTSKYVYGTNALILGTITAGMNLKPDNLTYSIPPSDYLICRSLRLNSETLYIKESQNHTHELNYPVLKIGDRVLVGVIGTEYVIIDVVV